MIEPVPTRDHTERLLLSAGAPCQPHRRRRAGYRTTVGNADELELEAIEVPGDLSSAAFLIAAGVLVAGLAAGARADRRQLDPDRASCGSSSGWGRSCSASSSPSARLRPASRSRTWTSPAARSRRRRGSAARCRWRSTSCRWSRCSDASRTARPWSAAPAELRVKESDRIATVVEGLRGLGADIEAAPDGFVVRGVGGLRGGRIDAHGDHRLALLGAVAGLASREGVEVVGMEAAAVSYPGFADDIARLVSLVVVAIDGPAGAGKSTVARAVARPARVHVPGLGRDVPGGRAGGAAARGRPGHDRGVGADRARRARAARRRGRDRRDSDAGGLRGRVARGSRSGRAARRWSPSSAG